MTSIANEPHEVQYAMCESLQQSMNPVNTVSSAKTAVNESDISDQHLDSSEGKYYLNVSKIQTALLKLECVLQTSSTSRWQQNIILYKHVMV